IVRLPAQPPREEDGQPAAPAEDAVAALSKRRILVVDDNVDAAESTALVLQTFQQEVHIVHDGPAALSAAVELRPDMVFLDIGLPGINGYEVARRLREMPEFRAVVLVAVTGYGQEEDRQRSLRTGFDHHLTKPVEPNALRTLLTTKTLQRA